MTCMLDQLAMLFRDWPLMAVGPVQVIDVSFGMWTRKFFMQMPVIETARASLEQFDFHPHALVKKTCAIVCIQFSD